MAKQMNSMQNKVLLNINIFHYIHTLNLAGYVRYTN